MEEHPDEAGTEATDAADTSENADPPRPVRGLGWMVAPAVIGTAVGAAWSAYYAAAQRSTLRRRCGSAARSAWASGRSCGRSFPTRAVPAEREFAGERPVMNDYARHEHHDFLDAAGQALADPPLQAALVRLTDTLMAGNRRGYAALADSDVRDHAKRIKEHTLAHLDRYLEQLEASVAALGGQVHWAADGRGRPAHRRRDRPASRVPARRQIQVDDHGGSPSQSGAGSGRPGSDGDRLRRVHHPAGRRTAVAPGRPGGPSHAREHRPHPVAAHRRSAAGRPASLAQAGRRLLREKFAPGRHGHHRRQLRRRRDRHDRAGHQRGQRPADDDLPARPRRPDGHREGHPAAGSTCRCS